jgi:hypothetical protein
VVPVSVHAISDPRAQGEHDRDQVRDEEEHDPAAHDSEEDGVEDGLVVEVAGLARSA